MLDQNTDRMWYVIGAVIVGAALIFLMNGTFPTLFANIGETFEEKVGDATHVVEDTTMTDGIGPISRGTMLQFDGVDDYLSMRYNFGETEAFTIGAELTDVESMNFLTNHRAGHGWRIVDVNDMKVNGSGSWFMNKPLPSNDVLGPHNLRYRKTTHTVVITWDGTTLKRYIDGVLVESDAISGQFVLETIMIGARINAITNEISEYAGGMISDFFVAKDHAFSAEKVKDVSQKGIQNNEPGLVIHYDFEEGEGDTVYDKSGNGNHGTITGAQWKPSRHK